MKFEFKIQLYLICYNLYLFMICTIPNFQYEPMLTPHSDTVFSSVCLFQGRCSRENCKYLHPPPHLKTQLEINGRNNLIQQKNMAMLAQQMQLANAMMPGTQLPPMVRGNTRMNTPQLLPTVRPHTCKSFHRYSSFTVCVALSVFRFVYHQTLSFPTHKSHSL